MAKDRLLKKKELKEKLDRFWNTVGKLLPHRYPFLLVDRVLEIKRGEKIVVIKNITIAEPPLRGHFHKKPVYPGVLIQEIMAQAGALLVKDFFSDVPTEEIKNFMIFGYDDVRFREPVVPGDQLVVTVTKLYLKKTSRAFKAKGVATVDGEIVAEAELIGGSD